MMKPGSKPPPLVAVDAPSGWHVENGDESGAHNAHMLSELLALMLFLVAQLAAQCMLLPCICVWPA